MKGQSTLEESCSRLRRLWFNIFVFEQSQEKFPEIIESAGNAVLSVRARFGKALFSPFLVHRWI